MRFQSTLPVTPAAQSEPTFSQAKLLVAAYLTEPSAIEETLPQGFTPAEQPLVSVFVAEYPKTNFGSQYKEAALLVSCRFQDELGSLCLGMVVDDDVALILGREVFGFPKKLAQIDLEHKDNLVTAAATRKGVTFVEIRAELGPESEAASQPSMGPTFLVKAFPAADFSGLEWPAKVVRSKTELNLQSFRPTDSCEVSLRESDFDRWAALPVKDVLFGALLNAELTLHPGKVVGTLEEAVWLPYLASNLR